MVIFKAKGSCCMILYCSHLRVLEIKIMKEHLISRLKNFDLINKEQQREFKYKELGGITNTSYLADLGEERYVVRIPGTNPDLINRSAELTNHLIANGLKITLPFLFLDEDTGIKISKYVPELRSFSYLDFNNSELRKKAFDKLSRLHNSDVVFIKNFSPMEAFLELVENSDKYEEKARIVGNSIVLELSELKLNSQPCHQDLYSENFVQVKDEVYLIDWEYSSQGDAFFDYGDLFMQNKFDESMKKIAYKELGIEINTENQMKGALFEMLSCLTWGLWAVNKSKVDCDIGKKEYFIEGKERIEEVVYRYENKLF